MMNSLIKAAALFVLAVSAMAQTLPRPAGPYFEPVPDWESKAAIEPAHIVIAPGDDILPQIANSGTPESVGYYTMFQAVNVSTETATFRVRFYGSNGRSMNMPLAADADDMIGVPRSSFGGTLSPGGYGAQVTVPNGSAAAVGYAVVTMDPPESVAVNATFVNLVPGRPPFMAGIPLSSAMHKTAFMPYLAERGFTPSLALVSMEAQDITLIARGGSDGEELCRATVQFGAGHHLPFLLRNHLRCTREGEGTLEIRGEPLQPAAIAGIGFIGHSGGAFVTQPIWTNQERNTKGEFAPTTSIEFNERFVGMRMRTNFRTYHIDFVMPWRFSETRGGISSEGSYAFSNTGENTVRLRLNYDDEGVLSLHAQPHLQLGNHGHGKLHVRHSERRVRMAAGGDTGIRPCFVFRDS